MRTQMQRRIYLGGGAHLPAPYHTEGRCPGPSSRPSSRSGTPRPGGGGTTSTAWSMWRPSGRGLSPKTLSPPLVCVGGFRHVSAFARRPSMPLQCSDQCHRQTNAGEPPAHTASKSRSIFILLFSSLQTETETQFVRMGVFPESFTRAYVHACAHGPTQRGE